MTQMPLSGRLPVAFHFLFLLKQNCFIYLVVQHVRIPCRITIELLVCQFNDQVTGGDLKGTRRMYNLAEGY